MRRTYTAQCFFGIEITGIDPVYESMAEFMKALQYPRGIAYTYAYRPGEPERYFVLLENWYIATDHVVKFQPFTDLDLSSATQLVRFAGDIGSTNTTPGWYLEVSAS